MCQTSSRDRCARMAAVRRDPGGHVAQPRAFYHGSNLRASTPGTAGVRQSLAGTGRAAANPVISSGGALREAPRSREISMVHKEILRLRCAPLRMTGMVCKKLTGTLSNLGYPCAGQTGVRDQRRPSVPHLDIVSTSCYNENATVLCVAVSSRLAIGTQLARPPDPGLWQPAASWRRKPCLR